MARTKGFFDLFNENMESLGLPAPRSLFGSLTAATAAISGMVKIVQLYGTKVTVAEMVRTLPGAAAGAGGGAVGVATAAGEALLVVGGLSAAYYVGACIGSLAVATGVSLSNGLTLADCFALAQRSNIPEPTFLGDVLQANPVLASRFIGGSAGSESTAIA